MADKIFRFGPVAMSTTLTTNILNPPVQAAAGVGIAAQNINAVVRHIRIVNKTAGAVTFSLWLGASAGNVAGTEVIGQGKSIAANDFFEWFGTLRFEPADFLVGGTNTATALSIQGEGVLAVT